MNTHFTFSSVLGNIFNDGQIKFLSEYKIMAAIGNRITTYDLSDHNTSTSFEGHVENIESFDINHERNLVCTTSQSGSVTFLSYPKGVILRKAKFFSGLRRVRFSGNGQLLAAIGSSLGIYKVNVRSTLTSSPLLVEELNDLPMILHCDWIGDNILAVGCIDGSVYLFRFGTTDEGVHKIVNRFVLNKNTHPIAGIKFLEKNGKKIPSSVCVIDESGYYVQWVFSTKAQPKPDWIVVKEKQLAKSSCMDINFERSKLVLGVVGGYNLYDLDTLDRESQLSLQFCKNKKVESVRFSPQGAFIAAGCGQTNQLVVRDYEAKTNVFHQAGHQSPVAHLAYTYMGDVLASGDDEGIIKVWDCLSGHSFVNFSTHSGPITGLKFSRPPNSRDVALYTSSLDGTCRAFDLLRYRNFRTFVAPNRTGFTSMEIDAAGEILAAAGQTDFGIYLYNTITSQLLDVLKGHEGPISQLAFSSKDLLASGSWDKTVRVWTIHNNQVETFDHTAEVTALAFRPDGTELAVATNDGQITFWDVMNSAQTGTIGGRRDIRVAANTAQDETKVALEAKKYYKSITYTADGTCILAGGPNQIVNMYSVKQKTLVKQFIISTNMSLDGMVDFNNFYDTNPKWQLARYLSNKHKKKTIQGNQLIPGSTQELLPSIACRDMKFSPTNREFVVATTDGISVFSTESSDSFLPLDIDANVTDESIRLDFKEKRYSKALIDAIRLNDANLLSFIFYSLPVDSIEFLARSLPVNYLERFVQFLAGQLEKSVHLQYILKWASSIFLSHGRFIQTHWLSSVSSLTKTENLISSGLLTSIRALFRSAMSHKDLHQLSLNNLYSLDYLSNFVNKLDARKRVRDSDLGLVIDGVPISDKKEESDGTKMEENIEEVKESPIKRKRNGNHDELKNKRPIKQKRKA